MPRFVFLLIGLIAITGVAVAGVWALQGRQPTTPAVVQATPTITVTMNPTATPYPTSAISPTPLSSSTPAANTAPGTIEISSPRPGSAISSPVTVSGQAPGSWFFEARFPVTIEDAQGAVLGQGQAQAQGDWQSQAMVPFSVTISYSHPSTTSGQVVLAKDDPSGQPANGSSVQVPVTFK